MPTEDQLKAIVFICQLLSNLLQPIWLFRFDPVYNYIYILAGKNEALEILIFSNGLWEFTEHE